MKLKDKNGNEVGEGDTIKYPFNKHVWSYQDLKNPSTSSDFVWQEAKVYLDENGGLKVHPPRPSMMGGSENSLFRILNYHDGEKIIEKD